MVELWCEPQPIVRGCLRGRTTDTLFPSICQIRGSCLIRVDDPVDFGDSHLGRFMENCVRFHMHLLPTYFPDRDAPFDVYYRQIIEQVQLAEELGWECFWFTEHHFVAYGGPVPNPAVLMTGAATRTSKIRLGCAISILPLRHPVQTAEDYAMVDVASGGRLEFGMGLGNADIDYRVYGLPRAESRERFEEAAGVIQGMWSHDVYGHTGKFWTFEDVTLLPRPVQRPHPPMWVAGTSAASLGWAGRHGFNIMTVSHPFPPEQVRAGVQAWRQGLAEVGIDPATRHSKLHVRVWVDKDGKRAKAMAEPAIARYDSIRGDGRDQFQNEPPETYDWEGMLAQGRNAYGTPEQCIEALEAARRNFDFDVLSTTFKFGGLPHDE